MAYVQLVSLKGPQGVPGQGILAGQGSPAANVGLTGSFYRDLTNAFEYGPKLTDNSWSGAQVISIIGPSGPTGAPGAAASIPNDITANSLAIAPVAGDATVSGITQKNSGGATVFSTDTSGGVQSSGAMSVAGAVTLGNTLGVTGATSLSSLAVSGASSVAAVTASGLVTAANVTLSTNGKVTFADGSTQATAATTPTVIPSRAVVYAGTAWNSTASANGLQNTYTYQVSTGGATGNTGFTFAMPFAGSVVGVSITNAASSTLTNIVRFDKNGTAGTVYPVGAASPNATAKATWPVGTIPFAANDIISAVNVGVTAAGAFQDLVYFTIQWTA